jgi:hypothetical protein
VGQGWQLEVFCNSRTVLARNNNKKTPKQKTKKKGFRIVKGVVYLGFEHVKTGNVLLLVGKKKFVPLGFGAGWKISCVAGVRGEGVGSFF